MQCDWCGRTIPYDRYVGGLFGPHYCSNKCKHDAESVGTSKSQNDNYDDIYYDEAQSLGFFGKLWRAIKTIAIALVVLTIIGYILNKDDDEKSDDNKKTEQTSTQTAKKQSATNTKNTSSSKTTANSKPAATKSSNSQSSTYSTQKSSSSASGSTVASNITTSSSITEHQSLATTSEVTESNDLSTSSTNSSNVETSSQIYLALISILENNGKSLKLCEAQKLTKGQEVDVIKKMRLLQGTGLYYNALKEMLKYCPKYANEYSKNGKYFASEAEFYQAYIAPNYSKSLKAKKKENR